MANEESAMKHNRNFNNWPNPLLLYIHHQWSSQEGRTTGGQRKRGWGKEGERETLYSTHLMLIDIASQTYRDCSYTPLIKVVGGS